MRRAALALAAAATVGIAASLATGSEPANRGIDVDADVIANGLDQPIYTAFAPGLNDFAYVVQREGKVSRVDLSDGSKTEFMDIEGRVSTSGEGGLLSIAFHPNYEANDLLYAYYTTNGGHTIRIDVLRALSSTDVQESSRRKVIAIRHPGEDNHEGGTVAFGPDDDYLYAGIGDGGGGGDPKENAQDKGVLLGKLIRINPRNDGSGGYRVPATNPFKGKPGRDEIYATGLRNPFRFTFDRPTGRIAIGDVGQQAWEEIDIENRKSLRGANFGWDHFEGLHRYDGPGDNEAPRPPRKAYQRPVHEYSHSLGNVVTGGVVVRDDALNQLERRYLYADFGTDQLRSFKVELSGAKNDRPVGLSITNPVSIVTGPGGAVYVTSLTGGQLFRVVP